MTSNHSDMSLLFEPCFHSAYAHAASRVTHAPHMPPLRRCRIFCAHTRFAELRVVAEVDHCAFAPRGAVVSALDYNCTGRLLASGVCGVFQASSVLRPMPVLETLRWLPRQTVLHFALCLQKVVLFDHRALCASVGAPGEDVAAVLDAGTKLSSLCWARADEGRLVTAEYAGGLALWDLGAGRQALRLGGHDKRVWSVDFSHHDANVLVTGSDDGTARRAGAACGGGELLLHGELVQANITARVSRDGTLLTYAQGVGPASTHGSPGTGVSGGQRAVSGLLPRSGLPRRHGFGQSLSEASEPSACDAMVAVVA